MNLSDNFIAEDIVEYVRRSGFFTSLSAKMRYNGRNCMAYGFMYSGSDNLSGFKLVEEINVTSPLAPLQDKLNDLAGYLLKFYSNADTKQLTKEEIVASLREDIYAFPEDESDYLNMVHTIKLVSPYFSGVVISCHRTVEDLSSFLIIDKYGSVSKTPKEWEEVVNWFLSHDAIIATMDEVRGKHKEEENRIESGVANLSTKNSATLSQVIRPDISVWGGGNN